MKRSIALGLFLSLSCAAIVVAEIEIPQEQSTHDLNLRLQDQLLQLDSASDILQYLGQAINRGSISLSNKAQVKTWIAQHLKIIRSIENQLKDLGKTDQALNIDNLYSQAVTIQLFVYHLMNALNNKLTNLRQFTLHKEPLRKYQESSTENLEHKIERNSELIDEIRQLANKLGLTRVNLLARKLDAINEEYHFTDIVFHTGVFATMGLAALYLLDKEDLPGTQYINRDGSTNYPWYLEFMGPVRAIKDSFLGPRPDYKDKKITNKEQLKWLGKLEHLLFNKASAVIATGIGGIGYQFYAEGIKDAWTNIGADVKRSWNKLKGFTVEEDKTTYKVFDDITLDDERLIGLEAQKEKLRDIARYVLDPEIYDRTSANPAKSILLTGPSGSGKTLLARALSGTINAEMKLRGTNSKFGFREVKWNEVVTRVDGIKKLIEEANRNAPCVLFIDELHNMPLQTASHGHNQTLNEFLTGLSGLNTTSDAFHKVIVLAATNRPDLLDPALLRSGRFGDNTICCEKPNLEQRKEYFRVMFRRNSIDDTELDLNDIAEQTEGTTFSDLDAIFKDARFKARSLAQRIKQQHLQRKIETHVHRINKNVTLTDNERKIISANLAGQTLLHMLSQTRTQSKFKIATTYAVVKPIQEKRVWLQNQQPEDKEKSQKVSHGKIFTYNPDESLQTQTFEEFSKLARIKLAGKIAEQQLLGSSSSYKAHTKQKALKLIKKGLLEGLEETDLPKIEKNAQTLRAFGLMKQYEAEVGKILQDNKEYLAQIAKRLETESIIDEQDVKNILGAAA